MLRRTRILIEPNAAAWGWRLLTGPALILDGIVAIVTFGVYYGGASLAIARLLTLARERKESE